MVVELSVAIACEDERKRNEMRIVFVWVEGIDVEGDVEGNASDVVSVHHQ